MQSPDLSAESGRVASRFVPILASTVSANNPMLRSQPMVSPTASEWSLSRSKRMLDVAVAAAVLIAFFVPMLLVAICVRLSSKGPAIFVQKRVGREGRLFNIYKFRSMAAGPGDGRGLGLTRDGDLRVTSMGRWMRRLKIDELPQFFNVLRGDMSLVGPRPKLPQYAAIVNMPYRPGITGAATLAFRHEEEILGRIHPAQLENYYHARIKPLKARIDVRYMCRATFGTDMKLIAATFLACFLPSRVPAVSPGGAAATKAIHAQPMVDRAAQGTFEVAG